MNAADLFLAKLAPYVAAGLFVSMLLLLEAGRRLGTRDRERAAEAVPTSAVEGAVFALLGLLIAFTFSGAASRFDGRRQLVTEEANAIGTAYLRIDLLPAAAAASPRPLSPLPRLEARDLSEAPGRRGCHDRVGPLRCAPG